jgi:hypothetical protein
MPASPSAGDIVGIKDYAGTFATNNVTVGRNGSNFDGVATDPVLTTDQLSVFFVYVDGTQGWKATQSDSGGYGAAYVTATGGTVTCCGDYKIHTFTGPGTFCVSCAGNPAGSDTVDYLVVAGGSAGGYDRGGGGGAGGFRESSGAASGCYTASPLGACVSALPVTAQGYPITVGAGGAVSNAPTTPVPPGSNSVFSTITSTGGGGAGNPSGSNVNGNPGGSGGGSRDDPATGGTGNTPPVSPPQGNPGGSNSSNHSGPGGGGGGATQAGFDGAGNPNPATFGDGGDGAQTSISGTATYYAGGGGSGGGGTITAGGEGGQGGGGNGATYGGASSVAGTTNTGGGGGAGDGGSSPGSNLGAAGGSGIVIIRYKYQ